MRAPARAGSRDGIGYELAKVAAERNFDLIMSADEPGIETAAEQLRLIGVSVTAIESDLVTTEGVDELYSAIEVAGRPVDALVANAGGGLGHAFLDQNVTDWRRVIDTNITGTLI